MASTFETIQVIATIDTSDYDKGISRVEKGNADVTKSANTTEKNSNAAFTGIAKFGLAAVAAAAVAVGVAITSNIGNAVQRVDTLNNFPRVLQAMGVGAGEASNATKILANSLKGLPTSLQDGARSVQQFVSSGLSVDKATKAFLGVNNALLATGADAQNTQIVMDSLQRVISAGSGDASTLQAILSRMPTVLSALSKESGKSQQELYALFSQDPQALLDAIIRLNEKGGAGMASLDKQAREATGGIGTAFDNMNNAITRGIANIITAIGSEDIANFITNIGKAFETALKETSPFITFLKANQKVITAIAISLGTAVGAITAWYVAVKTLAVAQAALNAVMAANPIGLIIVGVLALAAGFMYLWNNVEGFRNFFITAWQTMSDTVSTFVTFISGLWSTISSDAISVWDTVRDTVVGAFNTVSDTVEDVTDSIEKWIDDWSTWIQNISIVLGTILIPQIVRVGVAWGVAASQAVVAFTIMATSAVISAVITTGALVASAATTSFAWVTQTLPRIIAGFVLMSAQALLNAIKITAAFVLSSATTLISWGATFVVMTAGFVMLGVQALIAGARMALGMMLALGPIGLIIAAVIGAAALIIANWDAVKNFAVGAWDMILGAVKGVWEWVKNNWPLLLAILLGPVGIAVGLIIKNFDKIKEAAQKVWNWISNTFSTIGEIGASVVKGAVNSVIGFAQRTINGFIKAINSALNAINKIPGVNISKVGELNIPKLAKGGIITAPTLAMVGEGRESEAVLPLSKLDALLNNETKESGSKGDVFNITVQGTFATSKAEQRRVAETIAKRIQEVKNSKSTIQVTI